MPHGRLGAPHGNHQQQDGRAAVMSDGDRLMYVWDSSGTHDGPLVLPTGTVPPTGKQGHLSGTLYVELRDGKIIREETYWNLIELLAQIGAV